MAYSLNFSRQALKDLEKITEPYYSNIKLAISNLTANPRPPGCKKLKGRDGYRIRVADYRIIYNIFDTELIVDIIKLGHRRHL